VFGDSNAYKEGGMPVVKPAERTSRKEEKGGVTVGVGGFIET